MSAAPATPTKAQRIANLFLTGHALDDVAVKGLNGGWTRMEAIEVVKANGWDLDPSGRVPRDKRPAEATQPPRPVAAVPPPPVGVAQMIADGKAHSVAKVRRAAEKAEKALDDLRDALRAEDGREKIRRRIAELEAETRRLRGQLASPSARPPAPGPTPPAAAQPATRGARTETPINHGTWGGFLQHRNRGEDPCEACDGARQETMTRRAVARQAAS